METESPAERYFTTAPPAEFKLGNSVNISVKSTASQKAIIRSRPACSDEGLPSIMDS